jgi:DNA-binding SARP family transcriptional activator
MVNPDPGTLQDAARHAEAVADRGVDTSNAKALVKMRNALIRLENVAEEARKQAIEPALDDEMDVGDSVAGVQRLEGEQRKVTDKAAALEMLEDAGANPAEVVRINSKQFVDAVNAVDGTGVDPSEIIDREEYTFYRRDG